MKYRCSLIYQFLWETLGAGSKSVTTQILLFLKNTFSELVLAQWRLNPFSSATQIKLILFFGKPSIPPVKCT